MTTPRVVIIGAGMAGIACARTLADAGLAPVVLDKGRSPGGRMSTRRVDGFAFDHGAQYFTARGDAFRSTVDTAIAQGAVARWQAAETVDEPRYVGLPGMSGLVKHMAEVLDVRCGVETSSVQQSGKSWRVIAGQVTFEADILICTAPIVQTRTLLAAHGLDDVLAPVTMSPCWALLLGFDAPFDPGFQTWRGDGALSWIARNGSKPGRDGEAWVVHASPDWSVEHLELEKPEAAQRLTHLLAQEFQTLPDPHYAAAHRWRYAMVKDALGQPFAKSGQLYAGGDWALGPRVECAFDSGYAIAMDVLVNCDL